MDFISSLYFKHFRRGWWWNLKRFILGTRTMAEGFISFNEFQNTSNRVTKWSDLPTNTIFRIEDVKQKLVKRGDKNVESKYVILMDRDGLTRNVWLTSLIEKELGKYVIDGSENLYIQSLGLRRNKSGDREYYDFDIVKQCTKEPVYSASSDMEEEEPTRSNWMKDHPMSESDKERLNAAIAACYERIAQKERDAKTRNLEENE